MSTTIAHPGQIPSRGPSKETIASVLIGLALAGVVGFMLLIRQPDETATQGAFEAAASVSAVSESALVAEAQAVKELARSQAVTQDDIWQGKIDFLSQQYAARNPVPGTSDYLSLGFDYSALTAVEADQLAGAWDSRVDFMTKRYQAQASQGEDVTIPPHFVE